MLSIIIPVFNQHDMTMDCINAIRENTQDCEIIIVDNGSEPAFKAPFSGFIETRVIRNEKNEGFPKAVNQGIRIAKCEKIVVLNNDVIVTPKWSKKLIAALQDFSIVGPVTNYAAGMQRVEIETYESIEELNKAAGYWAENCGDDIQEVNFIIGFCMAFRKSVFDEVGEFDESMWPCSGEEVDFCLRAREKGHRVGIVTGCYVHHEGSRTFQDLHDKKVIDYLDVCKKTDEHLEEKWGKDFWARQSINSSPPIKGLCLNLGCGYRQYEGCVNIDIREETKPDLVCDVMQGLPYDDNSIDMIKAFDFLEHIPSGKVIYVMNEIWRVLKPGGIFESSTPDAEHGQGAFQDPNHVSFWVENSWLYFSDQASRALYGIEANFEIKSIERKETGNRVFHLHVIARALK